LTTTAATRRKSGSRLLAGPSIGSLSRQGAPSQCLPTDLHGHLLARDHWPADRELFAGPVRPSIMARIPGSLRKLLNESLQDGERVLWQGRPHAWADLKMASVTWWLGMPWIAMTALAKFIGWIDEAAFPLFMIAVAIMAIPIIHFVRDLQTLFVITDRRALILRAAWTEKKTTVDSTYYERMDKELEILAVSGNVGHLNFASGVSTSNTDADFTGRYGFRCVKNVERVRDLLAGAIAKYA
jgi:hypothetical protein